MTKLIKVNGYHRNAERVSSGISTQALIGEGKTVEETIEDFLGTFEAMKQDFHGRRKPSRKTIHKIQSGVDRFAKELTAIKFA